MRFSKSTVRIIHVVALILITLASIAGALGTNDSPSSFNPTSTISISSSTRFIRTVTSSTPTRPLPVTPYIQGVIMPPDSYSVYTGETYQLTVGVEYSISPETDQAYGPFYFLIESPPYRSDAASLQGSGGTYFPIALMAPSTPGTYNLVLNLYAQGQGGGSQGPILLDTATITYRAVAPVVTDWEVEKVWTEPASPGEGDQVNFHATIILQSTTSKEALTVDYTCALDKRLYYSGTLTFAPQPNKQDVTIPKPWTATKGTHNLLCAVDPNGKHNDPTPYPQHNFKQITFTVETYYAIIQKITTPPEVGEGDEFNVVITVAYRLPAGANLNIHHWNNSTMFPVDDQKFDSVSVAGAGTRDYTFPARAPYSGSTSSCSQTWPLFGEGAVTFNKAGTSDPYQKTEPGWHAYYNLTVRRPSYYALIDSVTAQYLGEVPPQNATNYGRVSITVQVRYLLPTETGLWLDVYSVYNATSTAGTPQGQFAVAAWGLVWEDKASLTQQDSVERTTTYTYEYDFPLSSATSDRMIFTAKLQYKACGAWHTGDEKTTSVSVPYTPPPVSIADYFSAAIQRIIDWFRNLFGFHS